MEIDIAKNGIASAIKAVDILRKYSKPVCPILEEVKICGVNGGPFHRLLRQCSACVFLRGVRHCSTIRIRIIFCTLVLGNGVFYKVSRNALCK